MLFVIIFAIGALAVPLAWDISTKGRNNILQRSGQDVLEHPSVQRLSASLQRARIPASVQVTRRQLSAAFVGATVSVVFIIIVYWGIKLLNIFAGVVYYYAVNLLW